ncbi:MAG: tRNA uridine-5-carboxymethylaminomethyl(34) synthesis GTPase MnmE [Deltaproteobacteria bacterium]|nr:tRNA uridine-5-carboxymethylaminomethyl(34) synthesis GTPase MnmE [Deltaproteobacteria bacterium]
MPEPKRDTICALATPPGQSALAIIRVSGPDSLSVLHKVFKPLRGEQKPFIATRGDVFDLDDGICIFFPEGKSFTGEASFELTLHGSPIIVEQVLEKLHALGVRAAQPGEFSLRAYLEGKLDLCEAEAIADLIHARSEEAAKLALRNLKGALADYLEPTRNTIVDILCEIEARLDFPDEELGIAHRERFSQQMRTAERVLKKLLLSSKIGQRLMSGARVALVGVPNAGKSMLLNALVSEDKALVHDTPGTTRDVIEANWILSGIPITLVDIAGLREDKNLDPVERMGIERAKKEIERADLILWLSENTHEGGFLPNHLTVPVIKILTKQDHELVIPAEAGIQNTSEQMLDASLRWHDKVIPISAKTGVGLADLEKHMAQILGSGAVATEEAMLTKARHKEEVQKAKECLQEANEALLRQEPDEIIAFELRSAGASLDRLLGKNISEDVLDTIFSRFCIGK